MFHLEGVAFPRPSDWWGACRNSWTMHAPSWDCDLPNNVCGQGQVSTRIWMKYRTTRTYIGPRFRHPLRGSLEQDVRHSLEHVLTRHAPDGKEPRPVSACSISHFCPLYDFGRWVFLERRQIGALYHGTGEPGAMLPTPKCRLQWIPL